MKQAIILHQQYHHLYNAIFLCQIYQTSLKDESQDSSKDLGFTPTVSDGS